MFQVNVVQKEIYWKTGKVCYHGIHIWKHQEKICWIRT